MSDPLLAPLAFRPVYQRVVWGGRRMVRWRRDLPEGPIGESWDLADHARGMSQVASGPLEGTTLGDLTQQRGRELVGDTFAGGDFPILIKLIDAEARLSVQVHPDDRIARELGVGVRGKTECWRVVGSGGELFQGTRPGVTRASFEAALRSGSLEGQLERFEPRDGDFFFIAARTVHALGAGCLLYEVQQTCDVTFRVWDWGRVGLNGKPRQTHVAESLATIDFEETGFGPVEAAWKDGPDGAQRRELAKCAYFEVEERRGRTISGGGRGSCSVVTCLGGEGQLETGQGSVPIAPMQTLLVPALAGTWSARGASDLQLLVARPR